MTQLIGTAPNQVPTNGDLGSAAYMDTSAFYGTASNPVFRNRIINGSMAIDQRNAGSSTGNLGNGYTVDRWRAQFDNSRASFIRDTDVPTGAGFTNSLKATCTTASTNGQSFIVQAIEGYNFAQAGYGTSSAKSVTLSFWVKSSIAGQYTATFEDADGTRCYSAAYMINAASTWEFKVIIIPGETSGSVWNKTNGTGTQVIFDLGSNSTQTPNVWGTADAKRAIGSVQWANNVNATFWVTGVQVEIGTVATPFEHRPYALEYALCQRYYEVMAFPSGSAGIPVTLGQGYQTRKNMGPFCFKVDKRSAPSIPNATVGIDGGDGSHSFQFFATTSVATGYSSTSSPTISSQADATEGAFTLYINSEL